MDWIQVRSFSGDRQCEVLLWVWCEMVDLLLVYVVEQISEFISSWSG